MTQIKYLSRRPEPCICGVTNLVKCKALPGRHKCSCHVATRTNPCKATHMCICATHGSSKCLSEGILHKCSCNMQFACDCMEEDCDCPLQKCKSVGDHRCLCDGDSDESKFVDACSATVHDCICSSHCDCEVDCTSDCRGLKNCKSTDHECICLHDSPFDRNLFCRSTHNLDFGVVVSV